MNSTNMGAQWGNIPNSNECPRWSVLGTAVWRWREPKGNNQYPMDQEHLYRKDENTKILCPLRCVYANIHSILPALGFWYGSSVHPSPPLRAFLTSVARLRIFSASFQHWQFVGLVYQRPNRHTSLQQTSTSNILIQHHITFKQTHFTSKTACFWLGLATEDSLINFTGLRSFRWPLDQWTPSPSLSCWRLHVLSKRSSFPPTKPIMKAVRMLFCGQGLMLFVTERSRNH